MSAMSLITNIVTPFAIKSYSHLGVAVFQLEKSINFFNKIGFSIDRVVDGVTIMKNRGNLELHLCQSDKPCEDDKNLLMDFPTDKYPGHTHAAFTVPSVEGTRKYLEGVGIAISGERKMGERIASIFARDPDRTTFEFENNYGPVEYVEVTPDMIGYPQRMDHVGIRISNPESRYIWYAEKLGNLNSH